MYKRLTTQNNIMDCVTENPFTLEVKVVIPEFEQSLNVGTD